MFPKQNCPVCQNRAWQGNTSGGLLFENTRLKKKIEDFKREIEERDKQITQLEEKLKSHICKGVMIQQGNSSSRDDYYSGKHE